MSRIDIKSSITLDKDKLQRSLTAMGTLFRKGSIPQNVSLIMKSDESRLQMVANDSVVFIRTFSTLQKSENPSTWCLDGSLLNKFIKTLGKGNITIQSDDEFIYAKQGRTALKIPLSAQKPDLNFLTTDEMVEVNISPFQFIKGLTKTLHACVKESPSIAMHGVCFTVYESGKFEFVGTDSKRMAYYAKAPITEEDKLLYTAIISKEAAAEIIKVFDKKEFKVFVKLLPFEDSVDDGKVHAECVGVVNEDTEFIAKTINASFPEYAALVNVDRSTRVSVSLEKEAFATRLNQISACSERVHMFIKPDGITFKSLEGQNGAEIEVVIDYPQDITEESELKIAIRYVLEALNSIDTKYLYLVLNEPERPIALLEKIDGEEFSTFTEVMMPVS